MLTARQKAFVDHFSTLRCGAAAARKAGYAAPSARITASRLLTKANVQAALVAKEAELQHLAVIDKKRVITEVMDGINIAKLQGNAGTMITGCVHLGRMLGLYEPETVKGAVSAESAAQRARFDEMSDEQLLEIIEGKAAA